MTTIAAFVLTASTMVLFMRDVPKWWRVVVMLQIGAVGLILGYFLEDEL